MSEVIPFGDNILVQDNPPETVRKSGLILPEPMEDGDEPVTGQIVALPDGKQELDGIKPKIQVLYSRFSGTSYKTESGSKMRLITKDDILAIVK